MLHEIARFTDTLVNVVVGIGALQIVGGIPCVVVDKRIAAAGEYDRRFVSAGCPGQRLARRIAVVGLVGIDVGQILFRRLCFLEDIFLSQLLVGLPIQELVAACEYGSDKCECSEKFQYVFHGRCCI